MFTRCFHKCLSNDVNFRLLQKKIAIDDKRSKYRTSQFVRRYKSSMSDRMCPRISMGVVRTIPKDASDNIIFKLYRNSQQVKRATVGFIGRLRRNANSNSLSVDDNLETSTRTQLLSSVENSCDIHYTVSYEESNEILSVKQYRTRIRLTWFSLYRS